MVKGGWTASSVRLLDAVGIKRLGQGCFNFGLGFHEIPLLVRNGFSSKKKRILEVMEATQILCLQNSQEGVGCWRRFRGSVISDPQLNFKMLLAPPKIPTPIFNPRQPPICFLPL